MTVPDAALASAVVRLGRRVVAAGLVVGAGGNVSIRTGPTEVLVTPSAHPLDDLDVADLVPLGLEKGQGPSGGRRPSSESTMHLAAHRARPDADVVLHAHPPYANLLGATGHPLRLLTTDHAFHVRRLGHVPYLTPGSVELADAVAARLADTDVVLLAHHGCLVVAPDADVAFERAVNLEAAATATYRALLLGDTTTTCPPEFLEQMLAREAAAGGPVYGKGV